MAVLHENDVILINNKKISYGKLSAKRFFSCKRTPRQQPQGPRTCGGDNGVRTHDLRLAKPALSQLSYVPLVNNRPSGDSANAGATIVKKVVGLTRFELVTSRLSAGRSDQLSYRPNAEVNTTLHPTLGQHVQTRNLKDSWQELVTAVLDCNVALPENLVQGLPGSRNSLSLRMYQGALAKMVGVRHHAYARCLTFAKSFPSNWANAELLPKKSQLCVRRTRDFCPRNPKSMPIW